MAEAIAALTLLRDRFDIDHATFQLEHHPCNDPGCPIPQRKENP